MNKEDKKLMFSELYSKRYQSYRLRRGETIVEFYEITSKPAILYQPQKRYTCNKVELSLIKMKIMRHRLCTPFLNDLPVSLKI